MFELRTKLHKYQVAAFLLTSISNFLLFIATLTPAWQVAEDLDAGRVVQSGLWLYCPGQAQCWYIFSDSLINYYEKVDVCRFFLIGDCRKKLLRTPYFFGWHYAVLIINVCAMVFMTLASVAIAIAYFKKHRARLFTILFDILVFAACLFLGISLMVFMINAEMLESKFLIGIKNTFEKVYGYSYYLAGLSFLILVFALLAAVLVSTYTFFFIEEIEEEEYAVKASNNHLSMAQQQYSANQQYPYQTELVTNIPPTEHGSYIGGAVSPNGQFKTQTRTFYSY